MKKTAILLAALGVLTFSLAPSATPPEDWENPAAIHAGTEPPRATFVPFPDAASALKLGPEGVAPVPCPSTARGSSTGRLGPATGRVDFWKPAVRRRAPGRRRPSPRTGCSRATTIPIYVNIPYEFARNPKPPFVPHDHNPVGSYRRTFTVPADWAGMDVYLQFGAVKSFFYVWVNGEKLGFSKDSKTPAEWNITKFLKPGENVLAAEVYRWSDGSYLECQDFWRLAGIERDVYLYAAPKVRIRDFEVRAGLDDRYRDGRLAVTVDLGPAASAGPVPASVSLTLLDAAGRKVLARQPARGLVGGRPDRPSGSTRTWPASPGGAPRRPTSTVSSSSSWTARESRSRRSRSRVGFRTVRDQERPAPCQRHPRPAQGRQPPRARSPDRPRHLRRVHAPGHRAHEAAQHQRRPDLPLPGRPALVRALRRVRPLPRRRGQYRVPRHGLRRQRAWPRTRPGARPTSTASCAWSSGTRTTPRSSSGRSATRPATASTSRPPTPGSRSATRRGRSSTSGPS